MRSYSSAAVNMAPMIPETARACGKSTTEVVNLVKQQFVVNFKQIDAFMKTIGEPDMRVWAFEAPKFKPGIRAFVATDIPSFYRWYRKCDENLRHFYEIIQEDRPCRLYFDLEYKKEYNLEVNSEEMLRQFIDVCVRFIYDTMNVQLDRDKSFLILDSSSEIKFSVHIIVHFPEQRLFQSSVALKPLVNRICEQMLNDNVGIIEDEDGLPKLFCDRSVYTKNRNFRLFLSSKCGTSPNRVLKLAESCKFYQDSKPPSNAQIFLDALVIPPFYYRYDVMEIPSSSSDNQRSQVLEPFTMASQPNLNIVPVQKKNVILLYKSETPSSPFSALDNFMLGVFRELKPEAGIRNWETFLWKNLEEDRWERMIEYQLSNCRYCYNKKREHRNQNVYWKVNLDYGYYVQRCFNCTEFETERSVLPGEIIESYAAEIDSVIPDFKQLQATQSETGSQAEPLHPNSKRSKFS
ncbi:DNA-directed primase/polymerase protein [Ditylenchus destructor]|nr:DNA-directed primase/polymerase protein [Ditylenchus destructor]